MRLGGQLDRNDGQKETHNMKTLTRIVIILAATLLCSCKVTPKSAEAVKAENDSLAVSSVRRIWGGDRHCAFTSIVEFKGKYYISFREADSHIFDEDGEARGATRILASEDGEKWESVAYLTEDGIDLRDPKLSVTSDGRLMVLIGGSRYVNKELVSRCPRVSFSSDGISFSTPEKININSKTANGNDWLWRVDWHDGIGYGVVYSLLAPNPREVEKGAVISLLKTVDGINYEDVANFDLPDFPNETTVRFFPDGRMGMMVRDDSGDCLGWWSVSKAPYTDWDFMKMDMRLGGPDFFVKGDDEVVMGSRDHRTEGRTSTIIRKGNAAGEFKDIVTLPSAGDCSYPGFIKVGDELWVSYYSTHETQKAAVYLAKLPWSMFE